MSDDLVADLRAINASYVCNRPAWTIAKCHLAADRIEELEDLLADLANAVAIDAPDAKAAARKAQDYLHTGRRQ